MTELQNIFLIGTAVLAIIAMVVGVVIFIKEVKKEQGLWFIGMALFCLGLIFFLDAGSQYKANTDYANVEQVIVNEAKVYMDGQKLDVMSDFLVAQGVVAIVVAVFGFVLLGIGLYIKDELHYSMLGVALMFLGFCGGADAYTQRINIEIVVQAEEMIADGAKLYMDGQEVDADKVVLKDYEITIKNDNIILSEKQGRGEH